MVNKMSFRRIPFQFEATDPAERRLELLRRFGIPSEEKFFVEPKSGLYGDMTLKDPKWGYMASGLGHTGSVPCSPRLQHRVPYMNFDTAGSIPVKVLHEQRNAANATNSNQENLHQNKTKNIVHEFSPSRVHVIPIKIERPNSGSMHKSFNSTTDISNCSEVNGSNFISDEMEHENEDYRKRHMSEPLKSLTCKEDTSSTKICNIPSFVEGKGNLNSQPQQSTCNIPNVRNTAQKSKSCKQLPVSNGSSSSKSNCNKSTAKCEIMDEYITCRNSLKQISDILSEYHLLKQSVEKFRGCSQDKEYRYFDEMLTRCMLKLDDIDTKGNDQIRAARKSAVHEIQECINVLESKVIEFSSLKEQKSENASVEDSHENKESISDNLMQVSTIEENASFKVSDKKTAEENSELCSMADIESQQEIVSHLKHSQKMESDDAIPEIETGENANNRECIEVQFASGTVIPSHLETIKDAEEIVA